MREFALGGLHGTPVSRIAQRVGVAQPYVFSLFLSKKDLFLAAVDHCFNLSIAIFRRAATTFDPTTAAPGADVVTAMGGLYVQLLAADRDVPLFQHQACAACADEAIRDRVRARYANLMHVIHEISGAGIERVDDLIRHGTALNVAAAMDVDVLSVGSDWVRVELERQLADLNQCSPAGAPGEADL